VDRERGKASRAEKERKKRGEKSTFKTAPKTNAEVSKPVVIPKPSLRLSNTSGDKKKTPKKRRDGRSRPAGGAGYFRKNSLLRRKGGGKKKKA